MVRGRLVKAWREARKTLSPVEAWAAFIVDEKAAKSYKAMRGRGAPVGRPRSEFISTPPSLPFLIDSTSSVQCAWKPTPQYTARSDRPKTLPKSRHRF